MIKPLRNLTSANGRKSFVCYCCIVKGTRLSRSLKAPVGIAKLSPLLCYRNPIKCCCLMLLLCKSCIENLGVSDPSTSDSKTKLQTLWPPCRETRFATKGFQGLSWVSSEDKLGLEGLLLPAGLMNMIVCCFISCIFHGKCECFSSITRRKHFTCFSFSGHWGECSENFLEKGWKWDFHLESHSLNSAFICSKHCY